MLSSTSLLAPQFVLMLLPREMESCTSEIGSDIDFVTFDFPTLISRPSWLFVFLKPFCFLLHMFMGFWVSESSARSSAKSRSTSCENKFYWISV